MFSRHYSKPEMTVRELKDCGFDVAELSEVELGRLLANKHPEKCAKQLNSFCKQCVMELSQAHLPKILTIESKDNQDVELKKMEQMLNVLNIMDIQLAVIHPLTINELSDALELNRIFFTKAVVIGQKYNISLAVENLIGVSCTEMRNLLDSVPGLGLNLDTAHAASSQWDIPESIRTFAKKLLGLHISDNNGERFDFHLTPGKGGLPWIEIIQELERCGYSGDFHMELPNERHDTIAETRRAAQIAYLKTKEIFDAFNSK